MRPPDKLTETNLTLAIPVHNDRDRLLRLLTCVARLGCVDRVIVVDDGSDVPLDGADLRKALHTAGTRLCLLRHDTAKGPGTARNRALSEVDTDYVLFLDADDLPTRELPLLLRDLAGQEFDFCLFQYHDTRQEKALMWGQMPWDQVHWLNAGVLPGALTLASPAGARHLARCANYPWNKVYRTAFLRAHAIGCSDILLHEDVELHWRSFLHAGTILTSDRICVIHFVSNDGDRLTNRTGPERLEVFGPLGRIATEIATRTDGTYAVPFARFAPGLTDWIARNLDPAHQERLAELTRAFTRAHLSPEIGAQDSRADQA